jgi:magnesium-transporting ATPase (P-type)
VWVFLVICILYFEFFLTLADVFPYFFLSCKANDRVKLAKTRHGPHSSTLVCICVVRLLFVLFYVLFVCKCVLPPGDNAIGVNKYIIWRLE